MQTHTITLFFPEKITTVEIFCMWVFYHSKNLDLNIAECDICRTWYHRKNEKIPCKERCTYSAHENCPIFKTPPPFLATSKILPPSWPWTSNNQSVKRKHNPRMTITCYLVSFLQVGFRFQYQLINLLWLSIDFFSFNQSCPQSNFKKLKSSFLPSSYSQKMRWGRDWAEGSLSTFLWPYIIVCAVVQKYQKMFFFFKKLFLVSFCITWKRK